MNVQERITRWAELAAAATPGPWEAARGEGEHDTPILTPDGYLCASPDDGVRGGHGAADAAHIAASRIAVPAMAAALGAVLDLANGWTLRGEHLLMAYSKTVPEEVGTAALLEAGAEFADKARMVKAAIESSIETALGVTA